MVAEARRRGEEVVTVVGRAGWREVEHELVAAYGEDVDDVVAQREVVDVVAEQLTGVVLVARLRGGARGHAAEEEHGVREGW